MLATVREAPRRRGAASSSKENIFRCVIGDKFSKFCDKSFPNIEKHNEHLKRFHSPIFWCKQCLHKFNSSSTDKLLRLDRTDHARNCPGKPSPKNKERRDRCYVMSEEQYNRFKSRKWKQTSVLVQRNQNGGKESLPQKSWRQIRETIFPGTATSGGESSATQAAPPSAGQSSQEIMAFLETRSSDVMPRLITQFGSPALYFSPQQVELDRISGTNTTKLSTAFSELTNPLTRPSTLDCSYSYVGTDVPGDTDSFGIGGAAEQETLSSRAYNLPEGDQPSDSVFGTGQWEDSNTTWPPIDERYLIFDPLDEQEGSEVS
ncbi:hypothetical protein FSARC_13163 [Fusarium sarcochroum]|uniref:Uncharacterized protein n=1 Tax=Fusarium sarcochroum TaxID=1208366 RepID=A0A8H4WUK6_9HYPO|nr:hypothetical protein FSARC_13163 [Fusarium sarcochroum]